MTCKVHLTVWVNELLGTSFQIAWAAIRSFGLLLFVMSQRVQICDWYTVSLTGWHLATCVSSSFGTCIIMTPVDSFWNSFGLVFSLVNHVSEHKHLFSTLFHMQLHTTTYFQITFHFYLKKNKFLLWNAIWVRRLGLGLELGKNEMQFVI